MRFVVFVLAFVLATPVLAQDVTKWVGREPDEIIADARWQAQFIAVMGKAGFKRLQDDLVIEEPMTRDGDWVVGTGCAPHQCGDVMGGFAISVKTGKILAVVRDAGGVKHWGSGAQEPPSLAAIAQQ